MVNIESYSTQALKDDGIVLRLRTEDEMLKMITYILFGSSYDKPIYSNTRGFIKANNPTVLVKEMIQIQGMYRKDSGIRIRGEVITISKDVLNPAFSMAQIKTIADRMSSFFFFSGFQCVYGVFDQGNTFRLLFGINSVSFADGHKYHHNNSDVRESQLYVLNSIIGEITGAPLANPFDFARLEFY